MQEADARAVFVKNGKPTSHVAQVLCAMAALRKRYGPRPANSLGAPDVAALRDAMVWVERVRIGPDGQESKEKVALTRKTVNGRLQIIKDAFRRARERGKVSKETHVELLARRGRYYAMARLQFHTDQSLVEAA